MIADLLAIVLAAQAVGITVTAHTKDGNSFTGVSRVAEFPFESSLGKITVNLKDVSRLQFNGDATVLSTQDGTTIRGKIHQDVWAISTKLGDFTLKTSDLVQLSVTGVRAGLPAPPPADAPPTLKPTAPTGLAPVKTLKLGAAIPRTLRSTDGKTLFLLDASDAKLHVVKMETLDREREISIAGGETALSVSPGGGVIVAAGKRTISLISLAQGKMIKSFSIEQEVTDVCVLDDQTVLASGPGGVFLISMAKQAVLQRVGQGGGCRLHMSKDGKRVYASGGSSILLPDKGAGRDELAFAYNSRSLGDFSVSPDGRYAVSPQGPIYRLAKSFVADFAEVGKVAVHWTSAWAPSRRRLYLLTPSGFVKEVDTDTWELVKSWALGYRLADAFVDETGGFLVGVGQPVPPGAHDREVRYSNQLVPAGDLLRFELPK